MENLLALWKAALLVVGAGGLAFLVIVRKQRLDRRLRRKKHLPLLAGCGAGFAGFFLGVLLYWFGLL